MATSTNGISDEKARLQNANESARSRPSVNDPDAIPDGGLRAWLQVAGSFFLFLNTWGIINTFGAYQTYYETGELFHASSSTISWIGGVQAFMLMVVGALGGPVYDAGHFKLLLWSGCVLVVFGEMMLSLCHKFWEVLLAQAFCVGIGAGLLFIPSVAIISTYFRRKLALVIGIAASGSSLGGVIYPIIFHRLQPQIGFGWATRVIGFIELATLAVPLAVMKVRVLPPAKRKLVDWSAFRDVPFLLFSFGGLIGFMGLYVPFFYTQYYSISTDITDANLGFYLLAILNAASVFGRVVPNFIADKVGPLNILFPCALITGVLTLCLLAIHSVGGIVVFAVLYGFFSGTFVSLPSAVFVKLSPHRGVVGTRIGMGFSVISIGVLIGTPIGGAILGKVPNLHWNDLFVYAGVLTLAGAVFFGLAGIAKSRLSREG